MNKNVKIAKELVKIAKSLVGIDVTVDNNGDTGKYDLSDRYWDDSKQNSERKALDKAEKEGKKYILYRKEGDLWRIRACKNFGDVKKGDLGGLIEKEENLSHDGTCWVAGDAEVYDHAKVSDDAQVYDHAKVYDDAKVAGNAKVYGAAKVYNSAKVAYAQVYDYAKVYGSTNIYGRAKVYGNAKVYGDADVSCYAKIYGDAKVDYEVLGGEIAK